MRAATFASLVLTAGLCFCAGCASPDRLVQANYSQIQQNISTQGEVEQLIGHPDNKLGDMWLYERPDKHLTVMIDFDEQGKVTRKQWVDGMDGSWHDTKDAKPIRP